MPARSLLLLSLLPLAAAEALSDVSDHAALIQVGAASSQSLSPAKGGQGKNLVVLFDGSLVDHYGNTYDLYKGLVNDPARQLTHYERGVDNAEGDGVRDISLSGLLFLVENYQPGDRVFMYGASRGCISARYLQGLIAQFGIPKTSAGRTLDDPDIIEYELGRTEGWKDVDIPVIGCIEGVLRTLVRDGAQLEDMRAYKQTITPLVKNFLHAMATEEAMAMLLTAEVLVPEETHQEQVWFAADHVAMVTEVQIVPGWLAERSQELGGLLLKDGFLNSLNYCISCDHPYPPSETVVIRNPLACRKELYGDRRLKYHSSIRDRMKFVDGWKPLTECCYPEALDEERVEWVSTPSYDSHRQKSKPHEPRWVRVTTQFADLAAEDLRDERLHVILETPSGSRHLAGIAEHKSRVSKSGKALFEQFLPYPSRNGTRYYVSGVAGPCADAADCSWNSTHFGGRDYHILDQLMLDNLTSAARDVSFVQGKLKVSFELLYDDTAARAAMNGANPRCSWFRDFDKTPYDMCNIDAWDYPHTCETLREEATSGDYHYDGKRRRQRQRSGSAMATAFSPAILLASLLLATLGAQ